MIHDECLRIRGIHEFIFTNVKTGAKRRLVLKNLVTTVGKTMVSKRLAGEGNDCNITYAAFGSGITEPALANTTLETETVRKAVAVITYSGVQVAVKGYFGPSEANGTLREYGLFGEAASATPNSGTLFCRVALNTTKTALETLTVRSTITIS